MIISESKFKAFFDSDLGASLEVRKRDIAKRVSGSEDYAAIERLVEDFRIVPIIMDESNIYVSDRDEMIPAEWFPNSFSVNRGKRYSKKVVRYHIPFTGEKQLLHCRPSSFVMRTEEISAEGDEISFDIINWSNDAAQMKAEMESIVKYLREQNGSVTAEVQKFNDNLKAHITAAINEAKQKKDQGDAFMSSLGIPRKPHER